MHRIRYCELRAIIGHDPSCRVIATTQDHASRSDQFADPPTYAASIDYLPDLPIQAASHHPLLDDALYFPIEP
jgi:hypothetical protein